MSSSPSPGLYIVATPIGNLGDVSARARDILATADVIACEDTRVTGKLLHLIGIPAPAPEPGDARKDAPAPVPGDVRSRPPLLRHDDHSDERARAALVARMADERVVLVCDAGTPLISDPGYRLVRDARAAGVMVTSIPGPCAAVTALTLAGLPTDRFLFVGFLPAKAQARHAAIAEIAGIKASLVMYESGPRLHACLLALAQGLGDREAAVARELTKLHEECVTGTLTTLAAQYAAAPRGEIVIVIAPPGDAPVIAATDAAIDAALTAALANDPPSRAAKAVAKALSLPRDAVYARALVLIGKS